MKKLTALILVGLAGSALASAANKDRAFYLKAAVGGLAEIEAGKLAQEKGASEAVKNFGAKMVADHTAANAKLMALAEQKKIKLPNGLEAQHKAMLNNLRSKSGTDFDAAYIKAQINDHQATVALLEREIASGKDSDAKDFANEILPIVKAHLSMLQSMNAAQASGASMSERSAPGSSANSQMNPNPNQPGMTALAPAGH